MNNEKFIISMEDIFSDELSFLSKKAKQRLYAKSLVGKCFNFHAIAFIKVLGVYDKDGKTLECHKIYLIPTTTSPYKYDKAYLMKVENLRGFTELDMYLYDTKVVEFYSV